MGAFDNTQITKHQAIERLREAGPGATLFALASEEMEREGNPQIDPNVMVGVYEALFGISKGVARMLDSFSERVGDWPLEFVKQVPEGADLDRIPYALMLWLLTSDDSPVGEYREEEPFRIAATLCRQKLGGNAVRYEEWGLAQESTERHIDSLISRTRGTHPLRASGLHPVDEAVKLVSGATLVVGEYAYREAIMHSGHEAAREAAESAEVSMWDTLAHQLLAMLADIDIPVEVPSDYRLHFAYDHPVGAGTQADRRRLVNRATSARRALFHQMGDVDQYQYVDFRLVEGDEVHRAGRIFGELKELAARRGRYTAEQFPLVNLYMPEYTGVERLLVVVESDGEVPQDVAGAWLLELVPDGDEAREVLNRESMLVSTLGDLERHVSGAAGLMLDPLADGAEVRLASLRAHCDDIEHHLRRVREQADRVESAIKSRNSS